ncbi:MAG: choice-of-anchor D domain-containing protein [Planctomycetes bacterium]|nr:choice-of-anchor D domain-containing protein [Planctomycetota bacterium]
MNYRPLLLLALSLVLAGTAYAQTTLGPLQVSSSNPNVEAIYQGPAMTYFQGQSSTYLTLDGVVMAVPNGTSVAGLGLTVTLTGPTGTSGVLGAVEVYPAISGRVATEWQEGNYVALPITLTPTSGTLANDTMYMLRFTTLVNGQITDYVIILVVGNPSKSHIGVTPTVNGQAINSPLTVLVGSTLDSVGLAITGTNANYQCVGLATTITQTQGTGIDESEFSGYGTQTLTVPSGAPSGTFTSTGSHTVRVVGWGINQYASGSTWVYQYFATVVEFVIDVITDPRIEVSDSTGAITSGDTAAGDRDFGSVDISSLATPWRTITISNTGVGNLELSYPTVTAPFAGAGASAFEIDTSNFSLTVPQGSSTTLGVRLGTGAAMGTNAAWVYIPHDDPTLSGPFSFQLAGTVTSNPIIEVSDSTGAFASNAAPTGDRDFGQVDMASMPTDFSLTVGNVGTGTLLISSISLGGAQPGEFALQGNTFTSIASGTQQMLTVQFNANTVGAKTAKVLIQHSGGTVFEVNLAGVATTYDIPAITVSHTPVARQGDDYGPYSLPVSGGVGPYAFQLISGTLPAGLSLDAAGTLSGTPTESGTFQINVRVEDSIGASSDQPLEVAVVVGVNGGGGGSSGCAAQNGTGWYATALIGLLLLWLTRRRRTTN